MPRKKTTPVDVDNQQTIEENIVVEETPVVCPEHGVVVNCMKLNVRKTPDAKSKIVCVIDKGFNVTINKDKSTDGWYAVDVNPHTSGYCMKQFIAIEQ